MVKVYTVVLLMLGVIAGAVRPAASATADRGYAMLTVDPSTTDATISSGNAAHVVIYDRAANAGNILLFLAGTGGRPPGPLHFLNNAVAHGYRVISLSYVDTPAVAQVCRGSMLQTDPQCAQHFREKRIYGIGDSAPIRDAPQDSIVNRLAKLLRYLASADPQGGWARYLNGNAPIWSRIAVAGQSQGGGMAEFMAQRESLARVIVFSGGWDRSSSDKIATWYFNKSATPANRWFAAYNVSEPMANVISQTYTALSIPASHTFALRLPVRPGKMPHVEGIANPAYQGIWDEMLGNGGP